jgi:hypothetical protein
MTVAFAKDVFDVSKRTPEVLDSKLQAPRG